MLKIKTRKTQLQLLFNTLLFTMLIPLASADDYHNNNMLIGDRASGLAGAYVSISDDPSGLYYNPAGVVYSIASNISANMNAYNYSRTEYKNALGGQPWIRYSSGLVPNFFGITQPFGPGILGFSYAVTDYTQEDQSQTFNDIPSAGTRFVINFNNQDTTNNIGPSYAISVNDKLSIGITLYGYARSQKLIVNQSFDFPQVSVTDTNTNTTKSIDHFDEENEYLTRKEYGIKPILGIMYSPMEKISLGLSLSKVFLLQSSYNRQNTIATNYCSSNTNKLCTDAQFLRTTITSDIKRTIPWQLNAGATWFVNSKMLLTSSLWIYQAIYDTTRPLVNAAGGLEYYFTGKWAMRMGAYTNMANTPYLDANKIKNANEHVNIVGATFSISHFTRTSSLTLGAVGNYGRGNAQILGNASIQNVVYMGASVFISASNSF